MSAPSRGRSLEREVPDLDAAVLRKRTKQNDKLKGVVADIVKLGAGVSEATYNRHTNTYSCGINNFTGNIQELIAITAKYKPNIEIYCFNDRFTMVYNEDPAPPQKKSILPAIPRVSPPVVFVLFAIVFVIINWEQYSRLIQKYL